MGLTRRSSSSFFAVIRTSVSWIVQLPLRCSRSRGEEVAVVVVVVVMGGLSGGLFDGFNVLGGSDMALASQSERERRRRDTESDVFLQFILLMNVGDQGLDGVNLLKCD